MTKIRFLQGVVVQDELQGTPGETRFAEGEIIDLAPASADHWISRGKAVDVSEQRKESARKAKAKK